MTKPHSCLLFAAAAAVLVLGYHAVLFAPMDITGPLVPVRHQRPERQRALHQRQGVLRMRQLVASFAVIKNQEMIGLRLMSLDQ